MHKPVFILFLLLQSLFVRAQNLVPNGSFEDTTFCPIYLADFSLTNWFSPSTATPDNYHECSSTEVGVPQSLIGYQYAQHGVAYTGILTYDALPNAREYLAVKLSSTLVANQRYYWCFWVSLCDSVDFASNNIGISLTNSMITSPNENVMSLTVYDNSVVTVIDHQNWTQIEGSFIAAGGENFLYIGNFFDDGNTSITQVQQNSLVGVSAYYFIDNVYLGEIPCGESYLDVPNVFTPNGDGVNDLFYTTENAIEEKEIRIFNRWGQIVFQNENINFWDGNFAGNECLEGIYFYTIDYLNLINGSQERKTGFIQLMR